MRPDLILAQSPWQPDLFLFFVLFLFRNQPAKHGRPTRPHRPSSSSRQAAEAAARHRLKRCHPTHLRPLAHLPCPSTPPETALPPHPLPSPSISPSPIPPPLETVPSIAAGQAHTPTASAPLPRPYIKAPLAPLLITAPCAALCSTPSCLLLPLL
jgi:hypothetical protein